MGFLRSALALPLAAFLSLFLYKATEASVYGSLRAPLFVALAYLALYAASRRHKWGRRAALAAGAAHTCLSLSLAARANFASSAAPLVPPLALAAVAAVYAAAYKWPRVGASAVLDGFAVFAGLKFRLVVFFKLGGVGDVEVLLGEAWARRVPFTVERLGGEVFLSVCFESFTYGGAERAAVEGAGWVEAVLRKGGFDPRMVEGWVEVERLLYAPLSSGWEAAHFAPGDGGWRTSLVFPPSGRRGRALAVRRAFKPGGLNPHPQSTIKAFISVVPG